MAHERCLAYGRDDGVDQAMPWSMAPQGTGKDPSRIGYLCSTVVEDDAMASPASW